MFDSLEEMVVSAAAGARPPERLTVSQAAAKYRKMNNPGNYVGDWLNSMVPYLVEPMDVLNSLDFTGMVFVGPAQCGKTELWLNWQTYSVLCDPSDMMLVEASQNRASDFSKRRVDRLHRDTRAVGERLLVGANYDNTLDKRYRNGMMVTLSWPTMNELSGKPIPRLFLTDYDRMPQDVDGEGVPFDLASARTTTFKRFGMTAAESSPSYEVLDPRWSPPTPHFAPPCEGILKLYNRGDRRRLYWICVVCNKSFEPDFSLMKWDDHRDLMKAAQSVRMPCPHCHAEYRHDPTDLPGKHEMNQNAVWLRDGERLTEHGEIVGEAETSSIASFWLKGPAAAFKAWETIVLKWLQAQREYENTGVETAIKTTVNVDQSRPYIPKSVESNRSAEGLMDRAYNLGQRVVPSEVKFLVATVDVQKNRFEVQVHGIGQGYDIWVIDRFQIRYSRRQDQDRQGQVHHVRPFVEFDDWKLLLTEVLTKSYPLADTPEMHMAIHRVISDSGGGQEATANAYNFWRWLRNGPQAEDQDSEDWPEWSPGLQGRFWLYKGEASRTKPRTAITYPDSGRQDRNAGARGEIPLLAANVTPLKNQLDSILERTAPGTGRINFPNWLDLKVFKELCVEVKNHKGVWENPKNFRNETWDLLVMLLAALTEPRLVGWERIVWTDPPIWASDPGENPLVYRVDDDAAPFEAELKSGTSFADLAGRLA